MSASSVQSNSQSADNRPLVFTVDDEPMLLELATMILQPLGFRVETFRDPTTALRAFTTANPLPTLILTDFAMHRMTGLDLVRDCRKINPQQKVLMVSGTIDERAFRDSPHQPDAFLPKPYTATDLIATVKKLVNTPEHTTAQLHA